MPTYHPPETVTYYRRAYWECDGRIHRHLSRTAAEKCERKYPLVVPRGRYGKRERATGKPVHS